MTCRHNTKRITLKTDPSCSGYQTPERRIEVLEEALAEEQPANGGVPQTQNFEILEVESRSDHLIMHVMYPSCPNCSFEGTKLMVFQATLLDAVKWKTIDPHFREPDEIPDPTVAPPPVARFPATDEGLRRARSLVDGW